MFTSRAAAAPPGITEGSSHIILMAKFKYLSIVYRLVSPPLGANGSSCIEFYYHMYGEDVCGLILLTREGEEKGSVDEVLWSQVEPQADVWIRYRETHELNDQHRVGIGHKLPIIVLLGLVCFSNSRSPIMQIIIHS
jgi:hypothetical protein